VMNIVRRIAIQTGGGDAPGLTDDEPASVGKSKTFNESEEMEAMRADIEKMKSSLR
jgi:hypothetical protein